MNFNEIITTLHHLAEPEKVAFKQQKFGIVSNNALGIYHADLKVLAKKIPQNDALAIRLFNTNIYEARLLCSKLYQAKNLTIPLMDYWVQTFENWEICDSFCMALFAKSPHAVPQALKWTNSTKTFQKRAGFTTIAAYCMADKKANNEVFLQFLPIIEREATDERLYVKKAVNWALRNIGKRNKDLHIAAINCAKRLLLLQNKTSTWVANNALQKLCKPNKRLSDYPRSVYRPKL